MPTTYYPPSPVKVSKKLTGLSSSYMFRAVLAILSVLLFFILYTAMVAGLAYLVYYSFMYSMTSINKVTLLLKIGAIAGSAMLFAFTLKFIFKLKNHKPTNRIKLTQAEYPKLWEFIYQICQETGAPKPKSIYADPDVNAYVSYTNMWLSLLLPVRKDLTIGLGLVSCLNLSEFKAVMSHEFGHFAQNSMKIGSYIVSANTIIHDMIFSRDKWDDLLAQWRDADFRLSFAAWIITPIIWIIRQVLNLFYQFLNIMHSSLSREMEFNADKVAVKTSGSDAIISGLWKLDGGYGCWASTMNHAYLASQKGIFVNNLYLHNQQAIDQSADLRNVLLSSLPEDKRGGKLYFSTSENSKAGMYASHPPNDKRQASAKVPYVVCEQDERSPWILFDTKEKLQEDMTTYIYKEYLDKAVTNYVSSEEFEQFIIEENKGGELLNEYDNAFEHRFVVIPPIEELEQVNVDLSCPAKNIEALKAELKLLMVPVREIEALMQKAQSIAEGTIVEKSFSFKGKDYTKKNLNDGYQTLNIQREKLFNESFLDWDKAFCAFYLKLAEEKNQKTDLANLYQQHRAITKFYKAVVAVKNKIIEELSALQERDDVSQSEVNTFGEKVTSTYYGLNKELDLLDGNTFVPMPNIDDMDELKTAIIEGGKFENYTGPLFENGGFDTIMNQTESVISHCQRLDQKSIGVILAYHKVLE